MRKSLKEVVMIEFNEQLTERDIINIPREQLYMFNIKNNSSVFPIPGLIYLKKDSKFLTVLFNGAVNREKTDYLTFQRWSWVENIGTNVLILPDSTLNMGNFPLGWGVGNPSEWPIKSMVETINNFIEKINLSEKNTLLYGSSAGGFQAFLCGLLMEEVNVVMENPQTNVFEYYRKHVDVLLGKCYPNMKEKDIMNNFGERFSLMSAIEKYDKLPFFIYIQNINDKFHHSNHYLPFISKLNKLKNKEKNNSFMTSAINLIEIEGEETHDPRGLDQLINIIKGIFGTDY